ncbi:MAG: GAF domain-containing protein [Deltaproteobacteria bacterium]|nr:GAF domain-containing protein [Deltaproteobacteria bacterium]
MVMARAPTAKTLVAHRQALVTLADHLVQESGVLTNAVELLCKVLHAGGGIAYRADASRLVLAAEHALPRQGRAWLAQLPLDVEPWFIAQRVARKRRRRVEGDALASLAGRPVHAALAQSGWRAMAAAPIAVGRECLGVLVLGAATEAPFDEDAMLLLGAACSMLALALVREREQERAREQRLQDARTAQLATVGLLASTVACDLAAPLGALEMGLEDQQGLVRRLRAQLEVEPPELAELDALAGDVAAALRRAQGITSRLLAFSRESEPETLDFGRVAEASVELVRGHVEARGVGLELVRSELRELQVVGREENLHMLIVQLLLYAAQQCEGAASGERALVRVLLQSDGDRHIVAIEQSGPGAGAERLSPTAFDAVFGGRPAQQSPAAALAIAKHTVLAHGGHIELGTSVLGGALIRVVLPAAAVVAPARERQRTPRPPAARPAGQPLPTALLVDDDDLFVSTVRRGIKTHRLIAVRTIAEARSQIEEMAIAPDVVFCEVALPDGYGDELHAWVAERRPRIAGRFVFLTGGIVPTETAEYLIVSGRPTLLKPLPIEDIAQILEAGGLAPGASGAPTLTDRPTRRSGLDGEPGSDRPKR